MRLLRLPLGIFRLIVRSAFLALGQIWANKGRSILTTIGIVIGVASVTAVIAALTGLKTNVLRDFESLGANKIYINPDRPDHGPKRYASWPSILLQPEELDNVLDHCPSVERLTRVCATNTKAITHADRSVDARVVGIEQAWHDIENRSVLQGRPFLLIDNEQARPVCLLPEAVRDKLHLDRNCVGQRVRISSRSFLIVGIVEPPAEFAMFGQGGRTEEVLIPFRTCEKVFRGHTYAMAASKSPDLAEEAQAELRFFLRRRRGLAPGEPDTFRVDPIQEYIEKFEQLSMMVTLVAGAVVGISLLVGGVGIMNIMLVSVSERTREIGLRKAVGARASAVLLQFLVEAVVLCLFGGLLGLGAGQMLTFGMTKIPGAKLTEAYIPMWAIAMSFGFAAGVGVLFGMFPAIKAARLDPIEALRHE